MIDSKTQHVLDLARQGIFGTPDRRNRGSSGKDTFWRCYDKFRAPAYYRGTMNYPYAKAGLRYRKELDKQALTRGLTNK